MRAFAPGYVSFNMEELHNAFVKRLSKYSHDKLKGTGLALMLRGNINFADDEELLALDTFPEDWKYYTLTFPMARYKHLSLDGIIEEIISCDRDFYSMPRTLRRVWRNLWQRREPLISLVGNLSYRRNLQLNFAAYADFKSSVRARV